MKFELRPRTGGSRSDNEVWTHAYSESMLGWEIRDENGLLVARVPDGCRERETDAALIASAPILAAECRRLRGES
jgi:hypothetical protein